VSDRVPDLDLGGHFALGPWRVRRAGYGAMQLAGDGVFGAAPGSRRSPARAAYRGGQRVNHLDRRPAVSTTATPDRFTTLPDDHALQATVVALEEHGFSVEVVGDLDAVRQAVLARIPQGSSVMTNTSVTLAETGLADAINDGGGRWESARNKMFALDFATQAQQMKAIGGQPDYALGSVHAVTRDGTLLIASASGSQLASYAWGAPT
jgi:LUD domain